MINRDYILRLAERFGHELSIILGLRQREQHEEALLYIDDLLFMATGLTSNLVNALPPEMLLKTFSPLGRLNVEACLWTAFLLKNEGDIYTDIGQQTDGYYRYTKALLLYLEALLREHIPDNSAVQADVNDLLTILEAYELPDNIKVRLFTYYDQSGRYDKAENVLFELLEDLPDDNELRAQGLAFYTHLLQQSDAALKAGNLPREEIEEGLTQLRQRAL